MRVSNTKPYKVVTYQNRKDDEGNVFTGYSDTGFLINGYVYHESGQKAVEQYGDRLAYIYRMLSDAAFHPMLEKKQIKYTDGVNTFGVGDALCIYTDKPDFKILSIEQHGHLKITMELMR